MAKRSKSSSESGIALLLAIFTLMLLSALGLALLGAADLETQVAANYRDKQSSIYASLSGLQEARDRLIPSLCQASSCNAPAIDTRNLDLPVPDEKYVIYIINPDTAHGETASDIKPWDPANKYYDSDLCNTPYFAAKLCTGGLPPTSNDWYRIYNDSNSLQGSYYTPGSSALPNPMQYKWVRVTLKADNMTEMPARWSSGPTNTTDGSQMCWQGTYEVPTTSGPGYNKACQSGGGVTLSYNGAQCSPTCTFNPPIGSNFTAANITITPPSSGTTALATATLASVNDGRVNSIYLSAPNNGGSGYTKAPLVTIDASPTGDNATAVAKLGGSPVTGYNLAAQSDPIGCYSGTPSVAVSGGSGDGATAVAAMTGPTCIAGWSVGVASGCTDPFLQNGKTITVSGSGGSGSNFAGKITFAAGGGGVTDAVITDPGSGYSPPPTGVVNGAHKLLAQHHLDAGKRGLRGESGTRWRRKRLSRYGAGPALGEN
jgi:hypothetical protein